MSDEKKDSIFDTERQKQKKERLVKDPTTEELRAKREQEKQYALNINDALETARRLIRSGGELESSLEPLFVLEKQTRRTGQGENTTNLVSEIIQLTGETKNWSQLSKYVVAISKKRNQLKQAITKMVQTAMTFLDEIVDKESKVELINALRQVCEGKIFVEVEQAHLVRMLADIKEKEGDIEEAATLIQTIQVETIGSMPAAEKIDLILLQMRLCLQKRDYVRAYVISRKVTSRAISRPEHKQLKIRYNELLIQYWITKKDYLEIARCYKEVFDCVKDQEDGAWDDALKNLILFVSLSPHDNHQNDLKHRVWKEKRLEEPSMKAFKLFLKRFVDSELIHRPQFLAMFGAQLKASPVFSAFPEREQELMDRIVEHNLRIISTYYQRVKVRRLSELLDLPPLETESFISKLVTNGTILAKIDRIDGVVTFSKARKSGDILHGWRSDIEQLLNLVEKSNDIINKELIQHKNAQLAK